MRFCFYRMLWQIADSDIKHFTMKLTLQGNCWIVDLPTGFNEFFKNNEPVDRRNGKPAEMEVYYLYHSLTLLSYYDVYQYLHEKDRVISAVLKRLNATENIWYHRHFTGSKEEIHFRFTNCGIRLLIDGYLDGIQLADRDKIKLILDKHLVFCETLSQNRIWYLHDSLELKREYYHKKKTNNNVWGSSKANMLILNTHIDTLITIGYVILKFDNADNDLKAKFKEGIKTLDFIINSSQRKRNIIFHKFDHLLRKIGFHFYARKSVASKIVQKFFIAYYWRIRIYLKSVFPVIFFDDGYIERDVGLLGLSFGYHVVNIWDLAKLFRIMRLNKILESTQDKLLTTINKSLEYTFNTDYLMLYTRVLGKNSMGLVQVCETLGILFVNADYLNDYWVEKYMVIRENLTPTCGMLGFDPLISDKLEETKYEKLRSCGFLNGNLDLYVGSKGRLAIINVNDYNIALNHNFKKNFNLLQGHDSVKSENLLPKKAILVKIID